MKVKDSGGSRVFLWVCLAATITFVYCIFASGFDEVLAKVAK